MLELDRGCRPCCSPSTAANAPRSPRRRSCSTSRASAGVLGCSRSGSSASAAMLIAPPTGTSASISGAVTCRTSGSQAACDAMSYGARCVSKSNARAPAAWRAASSESAMSVSISVAGSHTLTTTCRGDKCRKKPVGGAGVPPMPAGAAAHETKWGPAGSILTPLNIWPVANAWWSTPTIEPGGTPSMRTVAPASAAERAASGSSRTE
eukprot:365190-Chlamydomonas_euryale.AAC.11